MQTLEGTTKSRNGEDDHCWVKSNHLLLAPLDTPVMPSYLLLSVATTSLHILITKQSQIISNKAEKLHL